MSIVLSPLMNNLKMNTINSDELIDLIKRLLTAIPMKNRSKWIDKCKAFCSKYTDRTDA